MLVWRMSLTLAESFKDCSCYLLVDLNPDIIGNVHYRQAVLHAACAEFDQQK
jgi:hypothetical protein